MGVRQNNLHDFSVIILRRYKDVYVNSFFPHTAGLWSSLPSECFPLIYDLNGYNFRVNPLNAMLFWHQQPRAYIYVPM